MKGFFYRHLSENDITAKNYRKTTVFISYHAIGRCDMVGGGSLDETPPTRKARCSQGCQIGQEICPNLATLALGDVGITCSSLLLDV